MTPRTDVHSPTNLVTEDYEYAFCGVHHLPGGAGPEEVRWRIERLNGLIAEGYRFDDVHNASQCSHCGAHINYYAVLKHLPTKTLIHVGEQCLGNRFSLATNEFRALHKRAAAARAEHRIKAAREAFEVEHPEEFKFLADYHEQRMSGGTWEGEYDSFYGSLWGSVTNKGTLTDAQLAALQRSIERKREWALKREEEAKNASPCPTGRLEVTGEILSVKWHENDFGGRQVMTVRDDRGFRVWGSVPSAIDNAERGDRVTFTAAVNKSDRDETFGFFKRPTKARLLEAS